MRPDAGQVPPAGVPFAYPGDPEVRQRDEEHLLATEPQRRRRQSQGDEYSTYEGCSTECGVTYVCLSRTQIFNRISIQTLVGFEYDTYETRLQ